MVSRVFYANSMPTRAFQYAAFATPRALTGRTLQFAGETATRPRPPRTVMEILRDFANNEDAGPCMKWIRIGAMVVSLSQFVSALNTVVAYPVQLYNNRQVDRVSTAALEAASNDGDCTEALKIALKASGIGGGFVQPGDSQRILLEVADRSYQACRAIQTEKNINKQ